MPPGLVSHAVVKTPPWTWRWWRPIAGQHLTFVWVVLLHVTAAVGLVLFPLPGWPLFLVAGLGHHGLLSSGPRPPRAPVASRRPRASHLFCPLQWLGRPALVDREPP